jgi:sugar phosphate isomerase/epimerase
MPHRLGISGSTILTNPGQFSELFSYHLPHIEIGEFPDETAFRDFLKLREQSGVSFGLHSPLIRKDSKYDLLEEVEMRPELAWVQFEKEIERMAFLEAEYILVHFPYFKGEKEQNHNEVIEDGLGKLSKMQDTYGIQIVCEPKLGFQLSSAGINYLQSFPLDLWEKYGLKLCIDLGDYAIASKGDYVSIIKKWRDHIKVVHLHNVVFDKDSYIWVPVHPSQETDSDYFKMEDAIRCLSESDDVFFVLEHTPHRVPSAKYVREGIDWVGELIGGSNF